MRHFYLSKVYDKYLFLTPPQNSVTIGRSPVLSKNKKRPRNIFIRRFEANSRFFEVRKHRLRFSQDFLQLVMPQKDFVVFPVDQIQNHLSTQVVETVVQIAEPEDQFMIQDLFVAFLEVDLVEDVGEIFVSGLDVVDVRGEVTADEAERSLVQIESYGNTSCKRYKVPRLVSGPENIQ